MCNMITTYVAINACIAYVAINACIVIDICNMQMCQSIAFNTQSQKILLAMKLHVHVYKTDLIPYNILYKYLQKQPTHTNVDIF